MSWENATLETTLQTFNDTSGEKINQTDINSTPFHPLILSSMIVCTLGLPGNGVVIWCLCFRIKRNPITVYILNLGVADFLLLLCIWIFLLSLHIIDYGEKFIIHTWHIRIASILLIRFAFSTSLLFLTTISMERCIAVVYPIWYKCRRPRHLSTINSFLIWALAFTEAILIAFPCSYSTTAYWISHCEEVFSFYLVMTFGIIAPLMILSSLVLIIRVQRKSIKRQPKRLYRAILVNVLVFLVCTVPARLVMFLLVYRVIAFTNIDWILLVFVDYFLTSVNSSANPFIYFLMGRNRKRISVGSIVVALRRVFVSDNEEPGQDETPNPPGGRIRELE